jgi:nucleotide-binding universal stress UspA family protein
MKHILVAIDGSKPSFCALEHAAMLARAFGAELTLLICKCTPNNDPTTHVG